MEQQRTELEFLRDRKTGEWRVYTRTWESLRGVTPRSLLADKAHGRNRDGTQDLTPLIGPRVFSNPKPVKLLLHLLRIGSAEEDALVLDFFAGSGSTGDAVFRLNAETGGRRRFILVQLPEATDGGKFESIASIGVARLRAASALLPDRPGFKKLKLAASNLKTWDANFDSMQDDLEGAIDNLKPDRTDEDLLIELVLKYGLELGMPAEDRAIDGVKVHVLGAGALVVCLAESISREVVAGIAALKNELEPEVMRVVFRDSGFDDDVVKTNAVQILRQAGIDDVRSL